MATTLTSEELILQANLLSTKTNSDTNPNMTYSTIASRNKALNPDYFTAAQTSIVNAINLIYKKNEDIDDKVTTFGNKISYTIGDVSSTEMSEKFENLKTLMGYSTLIEGLEDLYANKLVSKDTVTETVKSIIAEENQSLVEKTIEEKLSWEDNTDQEV